MTERWAELDLSAVPPPKCRLCGRRMKPRTNTKPDKLDATRCADCAILSRATAPRR